MPSSRRWRPGAATIRTASRAGLWALAGMGVLLVLAGAVWLVWKVPPALYSYVPDPKDRAGAESATRTGLIAGLAGLAALGSLAVTARTYRLSLQGQLTDRYTNAVAQLGDDKLDIRLGGIYALERLAVDSRRDHPTIVEVLSAFVRERARSRSATRTRPRNRRTAHPLDLPTRFTMRPVGRRSDVHIDIGTDHVDPDIQAAISVLGRLPARRGIPRAKLSGANLGHTNFEKGNFRGAELAGADLTYAYLHRGDLAGASLTGANLTTARLYATNLTDALLIGADLTRARLEDADLTRANFIAAKMTRASVARANLTGAYISYVTLTDTTGLDQRQIDSAAGDQSTRLPSDLTRPASWPVYESDPWELTDDETG